MMREKIGPELVSLGLLTQQQLDAFETQRAQEKKRLHVLLIEKKVVSKADIAKAFGKAFGLEVVDAITEDMVDPRVLGKIPLKFLRRHIVMPVFFEGKKRLLYFLFIFSSSNKYFGFIRRQSRGENIF